MRSSVFLLSVAASPISEFQFKRQNTLATSTILATITSAPPQITPTTSAQTTTPLDCFVTSLKPTSSCFRNEVSVRTCIPTTTPILSCHPSKNCFKSSSGLPTCVPRNDTAAPAGIAFAVVVPIFVIIIAIVLIIQRLKEKKRRRQALDDRLQGVHMGMRGSRKVEVRFVETRVSGGEEDGLVEYGGGEYGVPAPPPYGEDDRRRRMRVVPSLALNGEELPIENEIDGRRSESSPRR